MGKIMSICKDIEKKEGVGSVFSLGSNKANLVIPRWSSGIEDLDRIIGGGVPKSRVIEIYGKEGSGKTSLGYQLASMCEMALYIPIEGTFDANRARIFGNFPKQLIVYRAQHGEQAMDKMMKFARAGIPLIILDSVPACKPKEDYERLEKNNEKDLRIGGTARLFSNHLPVIVNIIELSGTTVVLINQTRVNFNAGPFGDPDTTPGGVAIPFYASIRMKVFRREWISVPNKDPQDTSENERIGMIQKIKIIKSKVCNPLGEAEIPMFFDRGYVPYDDIKSIRDEIMKGNNSRYKK